MKKPKLVVMAAGLGSRFGGLKQMEPITDENEIILDFACYDAVKAGFEDIILSSSLRWRKCSRSEFSHRWRGT